MSHRRPAIVTFGCALAIAIGALIVVIVGGIAAMFAALNDEVETAGVSDAEGSVFGRAAEGLALVAMLNFLLGALPFGAAGVAVIACATFALRRSRRAWIATMILLSLLALPLLVFAAYGQLIIPTLGTLVAVGCLGAPTSRAWYARRADLHLVRARPG